MNRLIAPLPWHHKLWMRLWQYAKNNTIPHALLLSGPSGLGQSIFGTSFAKLLLCKTPQISDTRIAQSCNHCQSCHWVEAKTHPDYHLLTPESSGSIIPIETIRATITSLNYSAKNQSASKLNYKIIVIDPAEKLHTSSSDALLKILEEPPPETLFFLISSKATQLPITLRSRCQLIRFLMPTHEEAKNWILHQITPKARAPQLLDKLLHLTEGAPLDTLDHLEKASILTDSYETLLKSLVALHIQNCNPSNIAEQWAQWPVDVLFHRLASIISISIKWKSGLPQWEAYLTPEYIKTILKNVDIVSLYQYLDNLQATRKAVEIHKLNLLLSLESLAYQWRTVCYETFKNR